MIRTTSIFAILLTGFTAACAAQSVRSLRDGHVGEIEGVAFGGNYLATADNDGVIVIRRLPDFRVHAVLRAKNFTELAFTRDAKLLAAAGFDGNLYVYTTSPPKLQLTRPYAGSAEALAISPADAIVALAGASDTIVLWELASGKQRGVLAGHTDDIYSVRFSPDGKWLMSGGKDRTIQVWDVAAQRHIRMLAREEDSVYALDFSPDGSRIAVGVRNGDVKIIEVQSGRTIWRVRTHDASVHGVDYHPSGNYVAAASFDGTISVYDAATGKQERVLRGHTKKVADVAFSPDGQHLASVASDTTVRIWPRAQWRPRPRR